MYTYTNFLKQMFFSNIFLQTRFWLKASFAFIFANQWICSYAHEYMRVYMHSYIRAIDLQFVCAIVWELCIVCEFLLLFLLISCKIVESAIKFSLFHCKTILCSSNLLYQEIHILLPPDLWCRSHVTLGKGEKTAYIVSTSPLSKRWIWKLS